MILGYCCCSLLNSLSFLKISKQWGIKPIPSKSISLSNLSSGSTLTSTPDASSKCFCFWCVAGGPQNTQQRLWGLCAHQGLWQVGADEQDAQTSPWVWASCARLFTGEGDWLESVVFGSIGVILIAYLNYMCCSARSKGVNASGKKRVMASFHRRKGQYITCLWLRTAEIILVLCSIVPLTRCPKEESCSSLRLFGFMGLCMCVCVCFKVLLAGNVCVAVFQNSSSVFADFALFVFCFTCCTSDDQNVGHPGRLYGGRGLQVWAYWRWCDRLLETRCHRQIQL